MKKRIALMLITAVVSACVFGGCMNTPTTVVPADSDTVKDEVVEEVVETVSDIAGEVLSEVTEDINDGSTEENPTWYKTDCIDVKDISDGNWKAAMKEAIEAKMEEYWEIVEEGDIFEDGKDEYFKQSSFTVDYITDDDIPEIGVFPYGSGALGTGSCILYVEGDKIKEFSTAWCDMIQYIPKSGRILYFHGMHVPYTETVMTFPDQKELGYGAFASPGWVDGTDRSVNGEDMEYRWNDEPVSEADYNAAKEKAFGNDVHSCETEKSYTYDEIMEYLQ